MRSVRVFVTILVAIILLAAVPPGVVAPASCSVEEGDLQTVAAVLGRWAEHRRITRRLPGLALGIVCGDRLAWAMGFGFVDPQAELRATPTTSFRFASVTKVFTATLILTLRDQGLLQLDDPVSIHLADFQPQNGWSNTPITVRHLLTHTSGLPTNSSESDFNRMVHPTGARMMTLLRDQELLFEPGTDYMYSNMGFAVLGCLASAVTGIPYGQ